MRDEAPTSSEDDADWQQIYIAQAGRLRQIIGRRVASGAVDDVLQETFLRAYRSRHCHDPTLPIEPWLTTIAMRTAQDERSIAERPQLSDRGDRVDAPGADEELRALEQRRIIAATFGMLRDRQQALLHSVAIEGVSQAALARQYGIAPEAVRAAVLRARRRFQVVYERLARDAGLVGVAVKLRSRDRRVFASLPGTVDIYLGIAAMTLVGGVFAASSHAPAATASAAVVSPAARAPHVAPGTVPELDRDIATRRDDRPQREAVATHHSTLMDTQNESDERPGSERRSALRYDPLRAEAVFGTDGDGASFRLQIGDESEGPQGLTDVNVHDCERDRLSAAMCVVLSTGATTADAAETP